ncbi:hypothetical protein E2542_SST18716 [Spatholobus suberectus]|nr:hypothetical protein E2542_SST18716 [Spatholobus suberectus]
MEKIEKKKEQERKRKSSVCDKRRDKRVRSRAVSGKSMFSMHTSCMAGWGVPNILDIVVFTIAATVSLKLLKV